MDGRRWKGSIKAIQKKSKGILRKSVRADLFEPVAFGKQWAVASVTNGAAVTPVYPPNYWLLENSLMVHFKRRTSRQALASVTNGAAVTPFTFQCIGFLRTAEWCILNVVHPDGHLQVLQIVQLLHPFTFQCIGFLRTAECTF